MRGRRKSTYARLKKGDRRDTYGVWNNGVRISAEIVTGRTLTYRPGQY